MKVFTAAQVQALDAYTIRHEPIASIHLMERAARALRDAIRGDFPQHNAFYIFAGPGNNGGDGAALARLLLSDGLRVQLFVLTSSAPSGDQQANVQRVQAQWPQALSYISGPSQLPAIPSQALVIDALFGSGLSRPIEGLAAQLIEHLNAAHAPILAVDLPSGLMGEQNPSPNPNPVIRARRTYSLQFPKLAFFFPENDAYVGDWQVIPIGLLPQAMAITPTPFVHVDLDVARQWLPARARFQHKGHFGHSLLIGGSQGMMGAAILSARACMAAGAGLLTVHVPRGGYPIIQIAVPEAMASIDSHESCFSDTLYATAYQAVGVGPGLGLAPETYRALVHLLREAQAPMVIDADALNLLAADPPSLGLIPPNSILTPHPGEFQRLFGPSASSYQQLTRAMELAQRHRLVILLKGAYTKTCCPDGTVFINSTGNPGMGTAGSGDALTGVITALLGQGVPPAQAAALGAYIHGLAADLAAQRVGQHALTASRLIDSLGEAFMAVRPCQRPFGSPE